MNCVLHNLNYGWENFWCDPGRNVLPKEYVKGPFSNPKIACPFPYISLSQTEGELLRIRSGIPDCWGDYLIRQLLGDYDSMHKEDTDIAHKLRKDYRLYLGQGIPNPWITPLPHAGVVSCKGLKENLRNYIFHVSENRKKNRNCFSCEDNCLLEGSDTTNRCTCKSCHSKDADFGNDCKCIEILQNWVSENIHLNGMRERRGRKKRSKSQGGSSESSGCETDDEGTNACSGKTCLCPKIFRIALGSISSANSNISCIERQSKHEEYIFSKDVLYEDCTEKKGFGFFPCKKGIYRGNKHLRFKCANAASKQVQTETQSIEETKTVQTENGGGKIQLSNKCFRCTMHEHQQTNKCRMNPLETTMCISPGFVSNHAVICPYTCCDHLLNQKPYWVSAFERKNQKKKKQSSKKAYAGERHFEEDKVPNTCTESDGFKISDAPKHASSIKINKTMDYHRPCLRSFDNLKYLTDSRLKNYLRERETLRRSHCRTSQALNEPIKPGSLVREPSSPLEKLEKFRSLPSKPNLSGSYAGNPRKKDTYVAWAGHVDRGVMTGAGEETRKKEVITKYFKDAVESDESRTYGLIRSGENNRKRRKLVSSRKRRKTGGRKKSENGMSKLVNSRNTELVPGELAGHPERNSKESRSDFKYKQIASRKPEKETFAELLKRPLRGEHHGDVLEKMSPVKSRRSPDVMKFITGDLLVDEKSKT